VGGTYPGLDKFSVLIDSLQVKECASEMSWRKCFFTFLV
jgi:hypothetical protein